MRQVMPIVTLAAALCAMLVQLATFWAFCELRPDVGDWTDHAFPFGAILICPPLLGIGAAIVAKKRVLPLGLTALGLLAIATLGALPCNSALDALTTVGPATEENTSVSYGAGLAVMVVLVVQYPVAGAMLLIAAIDRLFNLSEGVSIWPRMRRVTTEPVREPLAPPTDFASLPKFPVGSPP